jgi:TolA-binding protein
VRAAARVLGGEAAYWARDYAQAAALYGGFLSSYPDQPQAPR